MTPLGVLLSVLTVLSSAILVWTVWRRAREMAPHLFEVDVPTRLHVDADGLFVETPREVGPKVAWDDIAEVRIRTTDAGPFAEDVFWEFGTASATAALVVPGAAAGIDDLLAVAGDRLTGFDYEAVTRAMGSTENALFEVWRASRAHRGR